MAFLEKEELKYVGLAIGFALVWFLLLFPFFLKKFNGDNFVLQFLLFNIGLTFIIIFVLKAIAIKKPLEIKNVIGWLCIILAIDIMMPPYCLKLNGEIIQGNTLLFYSSSDYFFSFIFNSIGIPNLLLFPLTYVFVPALLLFIGARLVKNFVYNL